MRKFAYSLDFITGISLAALFIAVMWFGPLAHGQADVKLFEKYGRSYIDSVVGVGSEPLAYPPLAAFVFAVLVKIGDGWQVSFDSLWPWFIYFCVVAAVIYVRLRVSEEGAFVLALGIGLSLILVGGDMFFARYDILVGLCVLLAWVLAARRKVEGVIFLIVSIALKLVPVIILPILLPTYSRRHWSVTSLALLAGLVLVCLPVAWLGVSEAWHHGEFMMSFHQERGIQLESTWSSLNLVKSKWLGVRSDLANHHFAVHNESVGSFAKVAGTTIISAACAIAYMLVWRFRHVVAPLDLVPVSAGMLLWALFWAPVFSPQYLLWVFPLTLGWLLLVWRNGEADGWHVFIGLLILAAGVLTQSLILPGEYIDLVDQETGSVAALGVRNLVVGVTSCAVFWKAMSGVRRRQA